MDTYFDFKQNIESNFKLIQDRVDFLEIYVKRALTECSDIDNKFNNFQASQTNFRDEISDFFNWYLSQNIFKKIWWNIRKYNYNKLKQIKNGSI
jgi:hypothetical protein